MPSKIKPNAEDVMVAFEPDGDEDRFMNRPLSPADVAREIAPTFDMPRDIESVNMPHLRTTLEALAEDKRLVRRYGHQLEDQVPALVVRPSLVSSRVYYMLPRHYQAWDLASEGARQAARLEFAQGLAARVVAARHTKELELVTADLLASADMAGRAKDLITEAEGDHMTTARPPQEFQGVTRDDVAREAAAALGGMTPQDQALVQGKPASVVLGVAFRRAQAAYGADRTQRTPEREAVYVRQATVASAALIFERADDPEAADAAYYELRRIENEEYAAQQAERDAEQERLMAAQWAEAVPYLNYLARTEERGGGAVAVYVKGSAHDIGAIDRATETYARRLGLRPSGAAGGGQVTDKGRTYIAQRTFRRP